MIGPLLISRETHVHLTVLKVLDAVFRCEFTNLQKRLRLWQFSKGHGQVAMKPPKECQFVHGTFACLKLQEQRCRNASARVFKIARTDIGLLKEALEQHPNYKIVHLIRDPRAIIYSRFSLWADEYQHIMETADALCSKMLNDYLLASRLESSKLRTVLLEDFSKQPIKCAKELFDFVGYTFDSKDLMYIKQMTQSSKTNLIQKEDKMWSTEKSDSYLATQKWRKLISYEMIGQIERKCNVIINKYNYKSFSSIDELRDLSVSPTWQ